MRVLYVQLYYFILNFLMTISLSALRQKLFELADLVVASGEPLTIERKGVQLQLIRADRSGDTMPSRLARLRPQSAVLGAPLAPNESPSTWQYATSAAVNMVESVSDYPTRIRPDSKLQAEPGLKQKPSAP